MRTKLRYYRKKTRITKSKPTTMKSFNSAIKALNDNQLNYHKVLLQPISSDKNLLRMENDNTITFVVAQNTNKAQIKEAFSKLYGVKVRKVNTLNVFGKKGKAKKAYIRLENDSEALNIASKIGIL